VFEEGGHGLADVTPFRPDVRKAQQRTEKDVRPGDMIDEGFDVPFGTRRGVTPLASFDFPRPSIEEIGGLVPAINLTHPDPPLAGRSPPVGERGDSSNDR